MLDGKYINGLRFVMTCNYCPEQYDVYDRDNKLVAYVRERHSHLTVNCPDVNGEIVYDRYINEHLQDVETFRHEIVVAIENWIKENQK